MSKIFEEDLNNIINCDFIDWNKFDNKTFLITGATGLISSILVKALLLRNKVYNSKIKLVLPVRNAEKAKNMFNDNCIEFIETSIENFNYDKDVDYVIHAASPTKSKFFIEKPVETLDTIVLGTNAILNYSKNHNIKSMVYLSSMEAYGTFSNDNVTEKDLGYIDLSSTRSCYSEGKRIAELMCYSFYSEYNIPVKMARIAQTFGPGISKEENRVYKVFADAVINKTDIVLKSTGSTIINYSYTTDTVLGILKMLLDGVDGETYNLVGNSSGMTILDSAKWLAKELANDTIKVIVDVPKDNQGFAPDNNMILNNDKIISLGWKPQYDVKEGYKRLIEYMREW